jgi:hypothetical protein
MLTVIFDLQEIESMSTTSVTCGNINRHSGITGDGITLMRIFNLRGKIPENAVL